MICSKEAEQRWLKGNTWRLPPYSTAIIRYMEYLTYHGTYADIPVDRILAAWHETYGRDRVQAWIDAFEKADGRRLADFDREDVLKP